MITLTHLSSLLFGPLTWAWRVAAHRRVLATLGGLDDRELADIGLTRQDLRDVSALPLAADPTEQLAVRAEERAAAPLRARGKPMPPDRPRARRALPIAAE